MLCGFAGCSHKDDEANLSSLLGEWICTYQKVVESDGEVSMVDTYVEADNYRLVLNADGTGLLVTGNGMGSLLEWDGGNSLPITYKVVGNALHVTVYRWGLSSEGTDEVWQILSLTDSTLEIRWTDGYSITCRFVRKQ